MRILLQIPKRPVRVAAAASVVVALGTGAGVATQTDRRLLGGGSSAQEALTVPALPHERTLEFEQQPEERLTGGASQPVTTEPVAVLAVAELLEDPQGPEDLRGSPPQGEPGQQASQGQGEQGEVAQAQTPPLVEQDPRQVLLSPEERAALALVERILREQEGVLMGRGFDYVTGGRRDPFASLLAIIVDSSTDPGAIPRGLAGFLIGDVDLKGIATASGRWHAMVIGLDQRAYFLEVGTQLRDGHVVAIRAGEVVFEQLVSVGGARTTREVTKRLRMTAGGGETR